MNKIKIRIREFLFTLGRWLISFRIEPVKVRKISSLCLPHGAVAVIAEGQWVDMPIICIRIADDVPATFYLIGTSQSTTRAFQVNYPAEILLEINQNIKEEKCER